MLKLKADPSILPVEIEFGGQVVSYEMRQLSGTTRDMYLENMTKRMKYNSQGDAVGVNSVRNAQAELITLCLFDTAGKNVPVATIQQWSSGTVQTLFEEAQKLSGLNKEAKEEAKND